jgi:hypothetical protein
MEEDGVTSSHDFENVSATWDQTRERLTAATAFLLHGRVWVFAFLQWTPDGWNLRLQMLICKNCSTCSLQGGPWWIGSS